MDTKSAEDFPTKKSFNFLEQSISLQKLSATRVVSTLWQNEYFAKTRSYSQTGEWPDSLQRSLMDFHSFSCRDSFDVPSSIVEIIDRVILSSREEIKNCELNYMKALLHTKPHSSTSKKKLVEIFIKSLDNVALKLDGTFNLQGCVENVLTSRKLDPIQKFKIACLFCLENHVREIWPWVSETLIAFNSPLMVYWKKILNNAPIEESFVKDLLILSAVAGDRNWLAFEYLWDNLSEENQTRGAIAIIQIQKHDSYSIRRVLFKLNEKQVREISAQYWYGYDLFEGLLAMQHYEYAAKFCHIVKNSIPTKVFSSIVKMLWNMVFNPSEYHISRIHQNSQLLLEIWLGTPNTSNSSFAFVSGLFATLDSNVRGVHHYDLTVIFELLENTHHSYPAKEKLWLLYWPRLVIRAGPSDLEKLMKLCYSKKRQIPEFLENLETNLDPLSDYFRGCVNEGLYSELYDCLNFFTTTPSHLEYMSKRIITQNFNLIVSHDDDKLAKCQSFINSAFCNEQAAEKFFEEMMLNLKFQKLKF